MAYEVMFTRSAERSLAALPRKARLRIEAALAGYAVDPQRRRDVRKVRGCPADRPRYRLRVGVYRATFRIIQDRLVVCVVAVGKKEGFE
ncbi:MAG: type II toxin-antitoxin system RelE/ParE family toxin [Methanospirillum sp.]|nr:type II toxin-antitoxin system RelE/ParE family toxin [Methanospirillum sp.]